jgi:uncharacterized membrane protein
VVKALLPLQLTLQQRWLAAVNSATAVALALPFLAPILLHLGRYEQANAIYALYQLTCHEWPFRAFFLFGPQATYSLAELQAAGVVDPFGFRGSAALGYKVAFCSRNVAIYAGVLLAGLCYTRWPRAWRPLPLGYYLALIAPMGLDGLTQLFGWRESSWELRTVTGLLFGIASVWLIYPRVTLALLGRPPAKRRPSPSLTIG